MASLLVSSHIIGALLSGARVLLLIVDFDKRLLGRSSAPRLLILALQAQFQFQSRS